MAPMSAVDDHRTLLDEEAASASDGLADLTVPTPRGLPRRGSCNAVTARISLASGLLAVLACAWCLASPRAFPGAAPQSQTSSVQAGVQQLAEEEKGAALPDCADASADGGKDPCKPPSKLADAVPEKSEKTEKCSWTGQSCMDTKCCNDPGFQCYKQGSSWAECKATCTTAPDPVHWSGKNWTCEELGSRAAGEVLACTAAGQDCTKSQCCSETGMQCYEKTPGTWATCKATCTKGMDLTDSNSDPWTCNKLGPKTRAAADWVASQCSAAGADCRKTQCCSEPGHQCFVRDAYWAQCKSNCTGTPDQMGKTWSCKTLGVHTPLAPVAQPAGGVKVAGWVADKCSKSDEDCTSSKCCSEPGMQCFAQDESRALCKPSCSPGPDLYDKSSKPWSCNVLGPRTPGEAKAVAHSKVAPWVEEKCAKANGGCMSSKCCRDAGYQCYEKNSDWSSCLLDCRPGENRSSWGDIDDKPWSCNKFGGRTPRTWGTPSLFCFAVIRTVGYEADLIRDQMAKNAGIFLCDAYAVFSNEPYQGRGTTWWHPAEDDKVEQPLVPMDLGVGPLGRVITIPFKPTYVGTSMDHTAGNTELFLHVWEKVKGDGQYLQTDWTIKVDPDAVLIAPRMRGILKEFTGLSTYIVNCNKPGMAPMMFGSVEVFSNEAMRTFFTRQQECLGGLGWKSWGEDYFMGKCLDMLGVKRSNQFDMVADGVCKGVDCSNPVAAAFHPKKDSASWMACFDQASARSKDIVTTPP